MLTIVHRLIARKTFYFLLVTNVLLTMETFPRNGAKNGCFYKCVVAIRAIV